MMIASTEERHTYRNHDEKIFLNVNNSTQCMYYECFILHYAHTNLEVWIQILNCTGTHYFFLIIDFYFYYILTLKIWVFFLIEYLHQM